MKKIFFLGKTGALVVLILISLTSSALVHTISVQDFVFVPSQLTNVRIGDTVRWIWVSGTHTTTSTSIPNGAAAWDHPITSSSLSFDYIPSVPGTYDYHCSIHFAMGMTGSFTVTNPTGIQDVWKNPSVIVYPNPFFNRVTFSYDSDHSSLQNLKIFDSSGRVWKDLYFPEKPSGLKRTVTLTDIKSGVYFFEFIDTDNTSVTKRIVRE
jgi:plastocyanin